jgi:hypothetical protein
LILVVARRPIVEAGLRRGERNPASIFICRFQVEAGGNTGGAVFMRIMRVM